MAHQAANIELEDFDMQSMSRSIENTCEIGQCGPLAVVGKRPLCCSCSAMDLISDSGLPAGVADGRHGGPRAL